MKPTVTNYYHQTLKGTWYLLKAVSKAMFFLSLGLLLGFLLFFFDKIQNKEDVKTYILYVLVLMPISLIVWFVSRKLYYSKVQHTQHNQIKEILNTLHSNNEITSQVHEREKSKYN